MRARASAGRRGAKHVAEFSATLAGLLAALDWLLALRQLTRHRKTQIQERAREANRPHQALEDTCIKLDCVATDILGKSGARCADCRHERPRGTRGPRQKVVYAQSYPRCESLSRVASTTCTR